MIHTGVRSTGCRRSARSRRVLVSGGKVVIDPEVQGVKVETVASKKRADRDAGGARPPGTAHACHPVPVDKPSPPPIRMTRHRPHLGGATGSLHATPVVFRGIESVFLAARTGSRHRRAFARLPRRRCPDRPSCRLRRLHAFGKGDAHAAPDLAIACVLEGSYRAVAIGMDAAAHLALAADLAGFPQ